MTKGCYNLLFNLVKTYWQDKSGATAIEYGLIAALIGVGRIGGLCAFGDQTNSAWRSM